MIQIKDAGPQTTGPQSDFKFAMFAAVHPAEAPWNCRRPAKPLCHRKPGPGQAAGAARLRRNRSPRQSQET